MADHPELPDCNTCMMIDKRDRLWLFWPTILANTWESCLTNYRVATKYSGPGTPHWDWQGVILLKPDDLTDRVGALFRVDDTSVFDASMMVAEKVWVLSEDDPVAIECVRNVAWVGSGNQASIGCGRDINATQAKTASDGVVNVLIEMKAYHFLSLAANFRASGPGPVAALNCSTNSSASFIC